MAKKLKYKEEAVLRYISKDGDRYKRVLCNTQKDRFVCTYKNVNGYETAAVYKTSNDLLYMANESTIFFPSCLGKQFVPLGKPTVAYFYDGQEALKDYIAERNPELYIELFNDVENI